MKKLIILFIACLFFVSCHQIKVSQSEQGVQSVLPPGAENFSKTNKDYWYSFTGNKTKYLIYYYPSGSYGECAVIIEDK